MIQMLFLGTLITAASGRLNDVVFSRNRGGPYIRSWVQPDQTPTTERQAIWDAMADCAAQWATLTSTEQRAWNAYSLAHPRDNRIGIRRPIGGFQEFTRANFIPRQANNLLASGFAFRDSPPDDSTGSPVTPVAFELEDIGGDTYCNVDLVNTEGYEDSAEAAVAIWVSGPQSPNRNSWPGPYTLTHLVTNPGSTPTSQFLVPNPIPPGDTMFIRSRYFDSTGRLGAQQRARVLGP